MSCLVVPLLGSAQETERLLVPGDNRVTPGQTPEQRSPHGVLGPCRALPLPVGLPLPLSPPPRHDHLQHQLGLAQGAAQDSPDRTTTAGFGPRCPTTLGPPTALAQGHSAGVAGEKWDTGGSRGHWGLGGGNRGGHRSLRECGQGPEGGHWGTSGECWGDLKGSAKAQGLSRGMECSRGVWLAHRTPAC